MDCYCPWEAEIIARDQDASDIFTLRLRLTDKQVHQRYSFQPGQFNMVYLFGGGEVPISIVSDPEDEHGLDHTIRVVGRVTQGLAKLKVGERVGIRGPFGRGWPMQSAQGKDVIVITGGLGCAPVVAAINYILQRRDKYGRLFILQGVRHTQDLIYQEKYDAWQKLPGVEVKLAAQEGLHPDDSLNFAKVSIDRHLTTQNSPLRTPRAHSWYKGYVTDMVSELDCRPSQTMALMCGPEMMMKVGIKALLQKGLPEQDIYLSMERSMHCGLGHCGHCQLGEKFVCKDGPVFAYPDIAHLLQVEGV